MARHNKPVELEVRVSFEAARIAPQCLADAYEHLVPIPRRPTRPIERRGVLLGPSTTADRPNWGRAERG